MRTSLMCSLIASTSLAAACGGGGGAKTAQELGDRALAALVAKDFNALKPLYFTADQAKSNCKEMPAEKLGKLTEELGEELADGAKDFADCLKTDWTGAKIVGLKGGEAGDGVEGCGTAVLEVKDIKLEVEVGGKKMQVRVNDPLKLGEAYYLVGGLRCKAPKLSCDDVYDNMVKIVSAAPEAKEGEKEMFSGKPEKKTEFAKMCGEMQSQPRFKTILECIGAASTYADTKVCEEKAKAEAENEMGEVKPADAPTPAPEPATAPAPVPEPAPAPAP